MDRWIYIWKVRRKGKTLKYFVPKNVKLLKMRSMFYRIELRRTLQEGINCLGQPTRTSWLKTSKRIIERH